MDKGIKGEKNFRIVVTSFSFIPSPLSFLRCSTDYCFSFYAFRCCACSNRSLRIFEILKKISLAIRG